jgi:hypothetical protein
MTKTIFNGLPVNNLDASIVFCNLDGLVKLPG